jgi:hypothetical protein
MPFALYLIGYKYLEPIVSTCGINNEEFHMELPYEQIKVQYCIKKINPQLLNDKRMFYIRNW